MEKAEWIYAGASPIIASGCSCPTQRFHLDWFKRSFVPEAYRHSLGVLDTNGNLIMHLGKYATMKDPSATLNRRRSPAGITTVPRFPTLLTSAIIVLPHF